MLRLMIRGHGLPCKVGFPSVRTPLTPIQTSSPSMEAVWFTITAPKASKGHGERRSERVWTARFIHVSRVDSGIGSSLIEAEAGEIAERYGKRAVSSESIVCEGFMFGKVCSACSEGLEKLKRESYRI
jgi:hypothetical protein